jgi:outer membrane protein insertion porin family
VSGRGVVELELDSPSRVRYEARVEGAEGTFTQPWKTGPFAVRGNLDAVSVRDLEVQSGFGRLRIDGQVGLTHDAFDPLVVAGTAPLSHLALMTPVDEANGEVVVDVVVTGRVARPSLAGTVRVAGGLVRQGPLRFDDLELLAAMDDRGVEIRQASARIAGGHVRATGNVALQQPSPERYRLELHVQGVDLAQLTAPRQDGPTITTLVDADMHVVADRLSLEAVRGEGALTRVSVSVAGNTLGLEAPVAMTVRSGTLTHAPLRLAGSAGGVTLDAALAFVAGQTQFSVGVDGELDLVVANPMLGDAVALAGLARVNGRVERDANGWHARGDARVKDGRMVFTDPSVVVSNVTATLHADGQRIDVLEGSARIGDGGVAVTGRLLLSSAGADVDLVLRADRVPLEYPVGWRTRSSGDLRLTGRSGAYRLAGEVVVHRAVSELEDLRPAPALDRVSAALAALEARGSLRDRMQLDVSIRLEDGLRVASSQINLVVDGAVRVGGTVLTPEVGGSLTLREGSTARVSRALVRLEGGRVELSGYPARQPELDVRGTTRVSGVIVDVSLSGPLDDVRMNLSSSDRSDLSQGDLATLILTGRTTSAAASESGAIVAEELASSLGRVLNRQLGGFVMIDLARDDSLIRENTNSTLRMSIAIPLSSRLAVIHSRSLDNESLRWVVDFQPGGDLRVRVFSNEDASEAVEVSHRFSFDVWSRRLRPPAVRTRPRIGRVTVDGASPDEETQIRSRMRLTPGDEFDHFRSQDAARAAQAWFVAQGFLEAAVDIHDETSTDASIDLTVHVIRGPLVRIEWRGDNPDRSLRARVTAGWSSVLPRDERAARLAREVRRALQASRYFAAVVTVEVTGVTTDVIHITFDVARGPRGTGVDLRFEGNAALPHATLAAALPARNTADFFALLEPEGARRLAAALRIAYATEGFLDMRVGTPTDAFTGAGERFTVTIPIVEGDRARVVALELPAEMRSAAVAAPALELRDGEPFRFDAYLSDRARMQTWLRNDGYPYARVTSVLEPRPDGLAVRFQAEAGPRVAMGRVRTAREGRTRQSVLENAVATSPGEVIRASSLDDTRERLMETGVFRSVDLRLLPVDGREDERDVVLDVAERSDINFEYSVRYTTAGQVQVGGAPSETQAGVQLGAGFELVNPFGWADRYRISGLLGKERGLLTIRYDRATFFGWHVPTEVLLYEDRKWLDDVPGASQRVTGATFEQTKRWRSGIDGRRLHERLRMQWGYTIKRIEYADFTRFDLMVGGLRAGLIHSLIGDTRDSITDPRHGMFWSIGSELALEGLGSDVNYYRMFGQFFVFVPLLPRLTWAQGYRIGVVPGDDPLLLLDSRFFAGGAASVRGFAERSLGPTGPDGVAIGGQASAIFNQELRFPLWKRLHGGVFYDAGNAFALATELDLVALRQSVGAGLRLMFPFGPVRFEWAHVIDRQAGEKPSRFLFSIGHAF